MKRIARLEVVDATPLLLNAERAGVLPEIVAEGEEDRVAAHILLDGLDGGSLGRVTGKGLAVVVATVGPAGLEVDDLLVAKAVEDVHLALDESTGIGGADASVEVWVDVGSENIDDTAELGGIGLPDVEGFSGSDGAVVTSPAE